MKVLVVEDEIELGEILKSYLEQEHFEVSLIHNGLEAVDTILNEDWDIVLLDLMLPGKNGIEICKEVRRHSWVPIIMVTARAEEVDRLLGLSLGADDYICKPYSPREVVARVKTVLRRTQNAAEEKKVSGLQLNENSLSVSYDGNQVELTLVEWRILQALASKADTIFSRQDLIANAYNDQRVVCDRTIDSHINKLRKKITPLLGANGIRSVYGAGYRLEVPTDSD